MTYSFGEEGPAIVQLQKWESSRLQANLTQFHEAFLSPTRELILLLSYHHEAEAVSCIVSYPMLSDINSLAWGICEDSNSQHEGALFREFLFVVGDHGLTAHAFCQSTECSSESLEPMPDVDSEEWVEWVPSNDAKHINKPENDGWDLKVSRIRRLQLALNYLNFQEIEISLEMLAGVSLAEEGVLRFAHHLGFSGVPSLLAFPPGCKSSDCIMRYTGELSVDAVTDWFATIILSLPLIALCRNNHEVPIRKPVEENWERIRVLQKAYMSLEEGYMPPVTSIVVLKRHHTRFFPMKHGGTVVDTKICHQMEFDFYLCSHAGIQGTSKPTHYHLLYDEN
ncbi:unnamed protein product [Lactuca virosa]|uniref:Piwi domain-containing protein n=1 Tax=Lactuca virosa TaxID=75947 RepID=A0AAU9PJU9_9ASTR|nr:unnamed protein product [Lactuca virosa]